MRILSYALSVVKRSFALIRVFKQFVKDGARCFCFVWSEGFRPSQTIQFFMSGRFPGLK